MLQFKDVELRGDGLHMKIHFKSTPFAYFLFSPGIIISPATFSALLPSEAALSASVLTFLYILKKPFFP